MARSIAFCLLLTAALVAILSTGTVHGSNLRSVVKTDLNISNHEALDVASLTTDQAHELVYAHEIEDVNRELSDVLPEDMDMDKKKKKKNNNKKKKKKKTTLFNNNKKKKSKKVQ
jgi:hypothetical protein